MSTVLCSTRVPTEMAELLWTLDSSTERAY